jgi:hypothetical protein
MPQEGFVRGMVWGMWRMLFTMDPFLPLDSLGSGLARHVHFE